MKGSDFTATLTTLLASIKEIFTWSLTLVGDIITTIIAQPLLLLPIGVSFIGVGFMIFRKLRR
jgi:hypothetical protein